MAQLSQQLRRFLDDQAWLENRRIMDILRGIEAKALALRESSTGGFAMEISENKPAIELPMERPLFTPAVKTVLADVDLQTGAANLDTAALYTQVRVDKNECRYRYF